MAKYLILWEIDNNRWPADPKESMALIMKQIEMTKQGFAQGQLTDWGIFPGSNGGFAVSEGDAAAVMMGCQQYAPYCTFNVQTVLSLDEVEQAAKARMP